MQPERGNLGHEPRARRALPILRLSTTCYMENESIGVGNNQQVYILSSRAPYSRQRDDLIVLQDVSRVTSVVHHWTVERAVLYVTADRSPPLVAFDFERRVAGTDFELKLNWQHLRIPFRFPIR